MNITIRMNTPTTRKNTAMNTIIRMATKNTITNITTETNTAVHRTTQP